MRKHVNRVIFHVRLIRFLFLKSYFSVTLSCRKLVTFTALLVQASFKIIALPWFAFVKYWLTLAQWLRHKYVAAFSRVSCFEPQQNLSKCVLHPCRQITELSVVVVSNICRQMACLWLMQYVHTAREDFLLNQVLNPPRLSGLETVCPFCTSVHIPTQFDHCRILIIWSYLSLLWGRFSCDCTSNFFHKVKSYSPLFSSAYHT